MFLFRSHRRKKTALHDDEEGTLAALRRQVVAKHALLEASIQEQLSSLSKAVEIPSKLLEDAGDQVRFRSVASHQARMGA